MAKVVATLLGVALAMSLYFNHLLIVQLAQLTTYLKFIVR